MKMNSEVLIILSLSISGSLLALILFAGKLLFRNKLSKAFSYYLWILVLLRLVIPVSVPINAVNTLFDAISPDVSVPETERMIPNTWQAGVPAIGIRPEKEVPVYGENAAQPEKQTDASQIESVAFSESHTIEPIPISSGFSLSALWNFVKNNLIYIWALGAAVSILWYAGSYLVFVGRLRKSNILPAPEDMAVFRTIYRGRSVRIKCNPSIAVPMMIGVFHPCIVIPAFAYVGNGMEREFINILHHELTHYKRKDLVYKWMVMLVTSLHWFNPLMFLIRREIALACELACDERVVSGMTAREKQSYGDTLIALASGRRFPPGIFATTLCEKEQLKERLVSIIKYKKKTVWTSVLSLILVVCLSGCGVVLGVATEERSEKSIVGTENSVLDISSTDASEQTKNEALRAGSPVIDFDGDGLADTVTAEKTLRDDLAFNENQWNASLTVELGSGEKIIHEIPGWWWRADCDTADFDADGKMDIMLILGNGGSNYDATNVYVYRVENGGLAEYAKEIITNKSIPYDQGKYTVLNDEDCPWVSGGRIVTEGKKPMLRLRKLLNYDPGMGITVAYYTNLSWNGSGWYIESMEIGEAFGDEKLITPEISRRNVPDGKLLPTEHRAGFMEPELIFSPGDGTRSWAGDPDAQGYDAYKNEMTFSARVLANIALQELYNTTAYQPEKCYVFCSGDYYCDSLVFSLYEDGYEKSFFNADFDASTGEVLRMNIIWRQDGAQYSPIDPAKCDLPINALSMTDAQIAQWFYENSTFGDRRAVVSAEHEGQTVKLTLENGDFYEVSMQESVGLPQGFYGPHPKGYTH